MPILTLNDPIEEIRPLFREVWTLRFAGRKDAAEALFVRVMEETVRPFLDAHSAVPPQILQKVLIQEKHRLEDVELITRKIREHFTGSFRGEVGSRVNPPVAEPKPSSDRAHQGGPRSRFPAHQERPKQGNPGGLDLAGMIDTMLEEERKED